MNYKKDGQGFRCMQCYAWRGTRRSMWRHLSKPCFGRRHIGFLLKMEKFNKGLKRMSRATKKAAQKMEKFSKAAQQARERARAAGHAD